MAATVLPRVHALVVCDVIDSVPGQNDSFNLSGLRARIPAAAFPYVHPQLCVYMQVTGRQGLTSCRVTGIPAGSEDELFNTGERDVQLLGPLNVVPVVWRIRNCRFPEPGVYYVQAYFDGKLANERLLILSEEEGLSNGRRATGS